MSAESDSLEPEFVQVAVDVPVRTTFTYRLPPDLRPRISVGHRLYVPFRGRPRTGVATALLHDPGPLGPEIRIETVLDVLDAEPILPESLIRLMDWVTRYYYAPPGEVLRLILPRPLRVRGKRLVKLTPFGQQCLEGDLIADRVSRRALELLRGSQRPQNDVGLRRRVSRLTLAKLRDLADKGLLEIEIEPAQALRGRRLVKFLRRVADPEEGRRLGMRQRAVLNALEGRQKVPLAEVRALTGASWATVRSLIRAGWVEELSEEAYRDPFRDEAVPTPKQVELTDEQRAAAKAIVGDGRFEDFRSIVLHGITGSGKTEVYVAAIASVLAANRRALLLLPEIALTPQLLAVFRAQFGDAIAVLHSALTEGERFDQWRQIRRGQVQVVIGARSAIFAPIEDLGMIVVDEEHDSSFKQDEGVHYHARDLALVRGQSEGAVVVLGSATPSLESLHRIRPPQSRLLTLSTRPLGQPLPEVDIVDMRKVPKNDSGRIPLLSPELRSALETVISAGQQAILFLNRRGHSPFVFCHVCGGSRDCPHCEISLTYHRRPNQLRCHYCDYHEALPDRCPVCLSPDWSFVGAGTEKLSDQISKELAGMRVVRLDRDTATGKNLRKILGDFREHRADVLVGTQMVTKGHDFPRVTLVGVVMADLSLRIPDFRSGERTFQLLAQVAGRAGRGSEPGRVLIQTFMPEHTAIQAASQHNYHGFAGPELQTRRELGYPPFGYLIALRFEGPDLGQVKRIAERYRYAAGELQRQSPSDWPNLRVLGPVEAPLARLRGRHRWQMLLQARSRRTLRTFTAKLLTAAGFGSQPEGVSVTVDVDPINLL